MDPSTSSANINSSETFQWKYDVFLSFRGEDTRNSFTDHLYAALTRKGINAYKDDKNLERGKNIFELVEAIKNSRFSIVIFSKNYAGSPWCLDELVMIIERVRLGMHTVVPIFYDVDPSEVSQQTGGYGNAMKSHKEFKDDVDKVNKWRNALTSVADHSGWDLKERSSLIVLHSNAQVQACLLSSKSLIVKTCLQEASYVSSYSHEVEFIEQVVEDILNKLKKMCNKFSSLERGALVGIDKHLLIMDEYLSVGLKDVRIVGIYGMGGIGKTTIARTIYEKFYSQFEGHSFVMDIREIHEKYGLVHLQKQILTETLYEKNIEIWDTYRGSREIRDRLCHKRILIVLDDVSQIKQLDSLIGAGKWFGNGSRIIITTRDEHLLITHGVEIRYKVKQLTNDEALQLFCLKAFRNEHQTSYHLELSNQFVNYAEGLPLALDVLGSFVNGKKINEWKSALERLKRIPNKEVMEKLKISYDGLEEIDKKIFLDIACFFKGNKYDSVIRILEGCGFDPIIGLKVLIEKSLITISHDIVWMHDLLKELGRDIVRKESPEELGRRSRLWRYNDAYDVLSNNTGTEKIEGIMVQDLCEHEDGYISDKALSNEVFLKMRNLRLLKLKHLLHWRERDLNNLPNTLRYVDWLGYPFKSFPPKFQMDNLVELHMQHSKIRKFWKETKVLRMLKIIDLSYSVDLVNTPNFIKVPNLEDLNLKGCISLLKVDESIGFLQRLLFLNLSDCKKLVKLPSSVGDLKSLKSLNLSGCSKLNELPDRLGNLTCLETLSVIRRLEIDQPSTKSWDFLYLWQLLLRNSFKTKPLKLHSLSNLSSLKELILINCNMKEEYLFDNLSSYPLLEVLDLRGNDFVRIPIRIDQVPKLQRLVCEDCKKLESLPELPASILSVWPMGSSSLKSLPLDQPLHQNRWWLNFVNCYKLVETYGRDHLIFFYLISFLSLPNNYSHKGSILESRCWRQEIYFSIFLPGGGTPWWFSNVYIRESMSVNLSPSWLNDDWMGFALCVSFEPQSTISDPRKKAGFHITFMINGNDINFSRWHDEGIYLKTVYPTSDHLWLYFFPKEMYSSDKILMLGKCSVIEVTLKLTRVNLKEWAFRLVYKKDLEELVQRYKGSNNLVLPCPEDNKRKHAVDDSCCNNEVGESTEGSSTKRLRMSSDIERERKGKGKCSEE